MYRAWLDSRTGKVLQQPFFNGQTFFQMVADSGNGAIETGSLHGDPLDEPGYGFPDELVGGLTHSPYVLSMSNSGPNTNGARFCLIGNVTLADRDPYHTVFGTIPGAASRAVVDAILGAGVNATTITGVQFRRTDAAAIAFDELAVPLPVVHALQPLLRVTPGVSVDWLGVQPVGSVLRAHQSVNLTDWSLHYRQFVGIDKPPFGPSQRIDGAELPARFYWFSQVTNPNATGISGFGGRTLTIEGPGVGTITYRFNAAGTGGTYENLPMPALLFSPVEGARSDSRNSCWRMRS